MKKGKKVHLLGEGIKDGLSNSKKFRAMFTTQFVEKDVIWWGENRLRFKSERNTGSVAQPMGDVENRGAKLQNTKAWRP